MTALDLISPVELAARLGARFAPTEEQAAVIGAPLEPAVVIAGAGSGKTETMAARVVWLVANGLVDPERVLGLTFTRKAAGELQQRIRTRLSTLQRAQGPDHEPIGEPAVLTYAAYAGRLVGEHGILLGAEPGARLLSEAARWQVADSTVRRYDGNFEIPPGVPASVTGYLLDLAGQLSDHLVTPEELSSFSLDLLAELERLPLSPTSRGKPWPAESGAWVKTLLQRNELIPLLHRFAEQKRREATVDFADQMVLAARLAETASVAEIERSRYDVVLLDEYQDTGHAQIHMLAALFADGRAVTAVGDPLQSIYGWRGASAGNISRFAHKFRRRSGEPAPVYPLMTSWRNDRRILQAANAIAAPLRSAEDTSLTARPEATDGRLVVSFAETEPDEAQTLAEQFRHEWDERRDWTGAERTMAVLVRKRSIIPGVAQALRDAGLPVEVVDLGGLLTLPEISDVVATLRVLIDSGAGGSLARLLAGSRWRTGPADLVALHTRARLLARQTAVLLSRFSQPSHDSTPDPDLVQDERIEASLVEALADLGPADHYSAEGYRRMSALAGELRRLRRRLDLPLPDLIAEIERVTGLDVEVGVGRSGGRENLDRFADEAARFVSEREIGAGPAQVSAFLSFLVAAQDEEYGLKPAAAQVHSERVQVLTVHGAKGLEWDVVAVAGMYEGGFPSTPKNHDWTRARSLLPAPLRGDRNDLPAISVGACTDRRELEQHVKHHHDALGDRYLGEERRLAYVALTRARKVLYASGAQWGNGKTPRKASTFLRELAALSLAGTAELGHWQEDEAAENPLLAERREVAWPRDPLAQHRPRLEEAARAVRSAIGHPVEGYRPASPRAEFWQTDVDVLLAERAAQQARGLIEVTLPRQLSASDLVSLAENESEFARRIRRPVPQQPARLARRGTAFHSWLEQRWSADTLLDLSEIPGAADEVIDDTELERLKRAFEASEWGSRTPVAVEVPFELTLAGRVVRGRMDAVFSDADGRFTVVDWKTGRPPRGADARSKAVQLAVYRLAWAGLQGLAGPELSRVGAAFHYVADNLTVAPLDLMDAEDLHTLLVSGPLPRAVTEPTNRSAG
ncbi:DEAD/DEAH box helicase [Jatrophihabitans telluris]|uniref:DNA 3'-5' helicase n=1 Tax=Jatrophihabitans telluris TaxID=2038343 RepID=A0ABY4R1N2_9ACTN|nr:UvrD-helicase domain-containing protein [Jatrophihabitans telluris]UQX89720.1 DEAD/DEAH box helicase [Jatrophihabitans telluris]